MAHRLHIAQVADLALGKPALRHLPLSATVAEAIKALQQASDGHLSVWQCGGGKTAASKIKPAAECECVGILSKLDVLCHLAKDESLENPERALQASISDLPPCSSCTVCHVDPETRLLDALGLLVAGAHRLVMPIKDAPRARKSNREKRGNWCKSHCWLTQEDVLRFLLGCLGAFAPLPTRRVDELGIINTEFLRIDVKSAARTSLDLFKIASQEMTSVAVVEDVRSVGAAQGLRLVADISACSLRNFDEMAALALATLSAMDFLAFVQDNGGPSPALTELVRNRSRHRLDIFRKGMERPKLSKVPRTLRDFGAPPSLPPGWDSNSLLDDEDDSVLSTRDNPFPVTRSFITSGLSSISCRPWSSLVAVIAQALANRVNHIWVTVEDSILMGIITFTDIIDLLLSELSTME